MELEKIIIEEYTLEDDTTEFGILYVNILSLANHLNVCVNVLRDEFRSGWRCKLPTKSEFEGCSGREKYMKDELLWIKFTEGRLEGLQIKKELLFDRFLDEYKEKYPVGKHFFWSSCKCFGDNNCRD